MTRFLGVTLAVVLVALMAGAALAYGPRGPMMGTGPQMMGPGGHGGPMGPGRMMDGGAGCPGMAAAPGAAETPQAITGDKAKELAAEYAGKYLTGFTVERVLPFAGRMGTAYQVELRGPKGETRILHVNPWGAVRPFGAPVALGE